MTTIAYLDSNATTSVHPAAVAAAVRVMQTQFGNPSSTHSRGMVAKTVLDDARAAACALLGVGNGALVFNSGATEGIGTAVLSALCHLAECQRNGLPTGRLLVYGATEHKAVPQSLAHWNRVLGLHLELRALPVNAAGQHDLVLLEQWLPETGLLCTMAANNETGVVSNLAAIEALLLAADATGQPRTLWLADCVQALGKLHLNLAASRMDYAPFSGHKLYAPKGVGMLYVRHGAPYTPLMAGGGQEMGLRSGTENMAGVAALGAVLKELLQGNSFAHAATLQSLRDRLEHSLRQAFPGIVFNAPLEQTLPTTLNFCVPGLGSKTLLDVFDAAGLSVSAGSACSAAKSAPSDVLDAMGLPEWRSTSALRMSLGPLVNAAEIDAACQAIARCGEVLGTLARSATAAVSAGVAATADTAAQSVPDGAAPAVPSVQTLQWADLDGFLATHPAAVVVDVREPAEHLAGAGLECAGRQALNIPLGQLASTWARAAPQGGAVPVVFVCRSGNRSLKAAQWLQAQGHAQVRHIHGGLALRSLAALAA